MDCTSSELNSIQAKAYLAGSFTLLPAALSPQKKKETGSAIVVSELRVGNVIFNTDNDSDLTISNVLLKRNQISKVTSIKLHGATGIIKVYHGKGGIAKVVLPHESRLQIIFQLRDLCVTTGTEHNLPCPTTAYSLDTQQQLQRQIRVLEVHLPEDNQILTEPDKKEQLRLIQTRDWMLSEIKQLNQKQRLGHQTVERRRRSTTERAENKRVLEEKKKREAIQRKHDEAQVRIKIHKLDHQLENQQRLSAWAGTSNACILEKQLYDTTRLEKTSSLASYHNSLILRHNKEQKKKQNDKIIQNGKKEIIHKIRSLEIEGKREAKRLGHIQSVRDKINRCALPKSGISPPDPSIDRYACSITNNKIAFEKNCDKDSAIQTIRNRKLDSLKKKGISLTLRTTDRSTRARTNADEEFDAKHVKTLQSIKRKQEQQLQTEQRNALEHDARLVASRETNKMLICRQEESARRKAQLVKEKHNSIHEKILGRISRVVTQQSLASGVVATDTYRPSTVPLPQDVITPVS